MEADVWIHTQPMPMPGSPCSVTEFTAIEMVKKLPKKPRIFFWSDSKRAVPGDWDYLASVRQGIPPEGIMAELDAWMRQYPDAWLAVDLRNGVIPPSTPQPLEKVLPNIPRTILVVVSNLDDSISWPKWELPF